MRHVRMLGLCLVAALALAAVAASSALALKNPTKSPKIFVNCPVEGFSEAGLKATDCVVGATELKEGGRFTVGPITTPISKQIILQYGFVENEAKPESQEFIAPTHGAEPITPSPEKVPGEPIAHITPAEQEELGWPESMKYSYAHAKKSALKTVYETIESAGNPATSVQHLLSREGTGVEVPVKVKGENKWLAELGDVCYIGSNEEPIVQHLTSGPSESPLTHEVIEGSLGEPGFLEENEQITEIYLTHSDLIDNTFPVPGATCTGPNAGVVEATIDKEFDVPQPAGASVTEIKGTLYTALTSVGEKGGA